ncbi:phosphatase PAP2 family protein [Streptomyces sp. 549]|uniref:phosphatase PAP2 family protein n=1 Tax=Streptomyces sp. 549 TaxID=3049076 RepID=UPI0024C318CF|nr:phosphatase PAP2 family protein [Streptomyces sp. 549]MDK1476166.1 phosphatase PAP2 family protein [Streptomyces sp. 549]
MISLTELRRADLRLTRRVAACDSPWTRRVLPALESSAQRTKLWWGAAAVLAATGGRGRRTAVAGVAGMALAELLASSVCKQLYDRCRPPEHLIPHPDVADRPDSSSFPSGHTAAAAGFTAAAAAVWPAAGAVSAVPAALLAVERVHSGAHYPTDVAAGAAVGLASAWLVHRIPRRLPPLLLRRLL